MKLIDSSASPFYLRNFGSTSGRTGSASALLMGSGTSPGLSFRSGTNSFAQVIGNPTGSSLAFDASGGFRFRTALNDDSKTALLLGSDGAILSSVIPLGLGATNWQADKFNLLNRANYRSGYTTTTSGAFTISSDFLDGCFDGSVGCDSTVWGDIGAASAPNKPVIEVQWTIPKHTQVGGLGVGWASRGWYPTSFQIEIYVSTDGTTYNWVSYVTETNWAAAYYYKVVPFPTIQGYIRGFRITVNASSNSSGLQIGELYCSVREAGSAYSGLYLDTVGGTLYGNLAVTGRVVIGNSALSTSATDGFLYIPTMSGAPSGTPTTFRSTVPIFYRTDTDQLYVYRGGWKKTAALT